MVKLTSQKLEKLVKAKTKHNVMYLGVFVDDKSNVIKPKKHAFVDRDAKDFKIFSVEESSIMKALKL